MVLCLVLLADRWCTITGAVVRNNQLEICVILRPQRIESLAYDLLAVINGQTNADEWLGIQDCLAWDHFRRSCK